MNRESRIYCSYCQYTNHKTTDCRYKPTYIKLIDRVNGKLKKTYNTSRNPPSIEFKFNSKTEESKYKKESKTTKSELNKPQTQRHNSEEVTFNEEVKRNRKKEALQQHKEKESDNKTNQLPKHITKQTKYLKCLQCLKWQIRLQENSKIVERLTNETLKLNRENKELEKEKMAYKILYEAALKTQS